jgi:hypothetical protein
VLSTPNILTTDNQKGEIMVGQNVPFKTGQTQSATTGAGSYFNTYERKDVGIKLTLTPQITSDDSVRLDVTQEISDVVESTSTNEAGPTTSKRSATTTVVVKDRQTMVIGGLIRDNVTSSTMKVPLLGDIPILGWLFKYKSSKVEKVNLMIFITPYIIKTAEEAAELTSHREGILEGFREKFRIEKKGVEPLPKFKPSAPGVGLESAPFPGGPGADTNIPSIPSPPAPDAGTLKSAPTTTISSAPVADKAAVPAKEVQPSSAPAAEEITSAPTDTGSSAPVADKAAAPAEVSR